MPLTKQDKNRRYYEKLKADPKRYARIRRKHNAIRKRNGTWNKKSSSDSLDEKEAGE